MFAPHRLLILIVPLAAVWLASIGMRLFLTEIGVMTDEGVAAYATQIALPVAIAAAPAAESASQPQATGAVDDWVRTRMGWEHEAKWPHGSGYEPALHPIIVAALVSLVALWALVAFPSDPKAAKDDPNAPDTTFMSDSQG